MRHKRVMGILLGILGIFVSLIGLKYFHNNLIVPIVFFSLIVSVFGAVIFTRAKYEGVLMDWSSLPLDVPYEINFFQTGNLVICINIANHHFDNRFLSFVGTIPARSTHLKVAKNNDNKLVIVFLSVKPEEVLITGGQDI